jgi:polyhydroxyalkanoate synthesis regulator phasin
MKRYLVVLIILAMAAVSAGAAYKIQLTNGKVINADDKPFVKDGFAYFEKNGVYYYVPEASIDGPKTENLNKPFQAPADVDAPKQDEAPKQEVAPTVIGDEQLEIIRKRSRLANEGQLSTPPTSYMGEEAETKEKMPAPPSEADQSRKSLEDLRTQVQDLMAQKNEKTAQASSLQAQISTLRDKFNFSTQYNDQQAIQSQIDAVQQQYDSVKSEMSALDSQIQVLNQQIASTPVVIERN